MKRKKLFIVALLMAAMLLICGCGQKDPGQKRDEAIIEEAAGTETPAEKTPVTPGTAAVTATEETEDEAAEEAGTASAAEAQEIPGTAEEAEDTAEPGSEPQTEEEPEAITAPGAETAEEVEDQRTEEPGEESKDSGEAAASAREEEEPEEGTSTSETSAEGLNWTETAEEPEEAAAVEESPEPVRTAEITVPAEFGEESYAIGEVTRNDDGSVTYRLTEQEHEQLLAEVHAAIQNRLESMCASPFFPNFFSITANEDCTGFRFV